MFLGSLLVGLAFAVPLRFSVVIEFYVKENPPTKFICASLTKEDRGNGVLYSCKEWQQVSLNAWGWDAWGAPIHQKAGVNPCDRYGYDSEQCRDAVFDFAAMKVDEAMP